MKKLIMLILLTIVKLTVFSQIGIQESVETKCLPVPVIKNIIKDLISGDSAKSQLTLTEQQLSLTEYKVSLKDSVINYLGEKEKNYISQLDFTNRKYEALRDYTEDLEKKFQKINLQLSFEKKKNKIKNYIIGSGFTIAVGYTALWYYVLRK